MFGYENRAALKRQRLIKRFVLRITILMHCTAINHHIIYWNVIYGLTLHPNTKMTNTEVWPTHYYSAALHSNYSSHDIPGCHRTHKGPEHLFRVVCIPSKIYIICSFLRLWDAENDGPQALDAISIKKNRSMV